MFSGNIFVGTLNIDIVKPSMKKKKKKKKKKKITSSKKALEDDMTQTVNKCVKSKSKLQLKRLIVLKSVVYLMRQPPHKTVLIKVNDL